MHVLFISRCPPYPLYLGDRLILYHLARELSQRGHTLDLLAFDDRPDIPDERDHYARFFRHIEILPAAPRPLISMMWRLINPSARFPHHAEASWSPAMWRAIVSRIQAEPYDAVHLFGGIQIYEFAHALGKLPALITPYESYALYLKRQLATTRSLSRQLQYRLACAYERFMFTSYRPVVVVSDRDQAELRSINPALEVEVIPNGIDLAAFPSPDFDAPRQPNTLLFTGNYEYPPNVDAALTLASDILPQVHRAIPDATLYLVGNAPPTELQALANDHIIVTGRVPSISDYLNTATVYVSPLRFGAGIKNKVLEAMASGCPVIATPLSVDGTAVTDGEHALIRDTSDMPAAIIDLLHNPDQRRLLAINARAVIESRYTWARVAADYEKFYQAITIEK
jgi:glycosyltransferase involved in cell wall biosynthesis